MRQQSGQRSDTTNSRVARELRFAILPVFLVAGVAVFSGSVTLSAQASTLPWTVAVTPTMDPLPGGFCAAVRFSIADAAKQVPRNPAGFLVSLSDFDVVASGASVVAVNNGSGNWSVCTCPDATVGSIATITASYPAAALAPKGRIEGVTAKASATFTTGKPGGSASPPGCPVRQPVSLQPVSPQPSKTQAPAVLTAPGRAPAPTGVTVTGTPTTAKLSWNEVPGVTSYIVTRQQTGVVAVQQVLAYSNTGMVDTGLQAGTSYSYSIRAVQADGRDASTQVQFTTPMTLANAAPDLRASNGTVSPLSVVTSTSGGGKVTASWTVANRGNAPAKPSFTVAGISQSPNFSGSRLARFQVPSLAVNETFAQGAVMTAPDKAGVYYVWVITDGTNSAGQGTAPILKDYVMLGSFTVTVTTANLRVLKGSVSASSFVSVNKSNGKLLTSWTIENGGTGTSAPSSSTVSIGASSTSTSPLTSSKKDIPSLAVGATHALGAALVTPNTPGTYYVWVTTDNFSAKGANATYVGDNRMMIGSFTVTAAPPSR